MCIIVGVMLLSRKRETIYPPSGWDGYPPPPPSGWDGYPPPPPPPPHQGGTVNPPHQGGMVNTPPPPPVPIRVITIGPNHSFPPAHRINNTQPSMWESTNTDSQHHPTLS